LQDYLYIDRVKVRELLTYHDLIELESRDQFIMDQNKETLNKENQDFKKLIKKIPKKLTKKYILLFEEFQKQETKEAKFAKTIDKLEPIIHFLDYKDSWGKNGFISEKILKKYKEKYFVEFKTIHDFFNQIIEYLNKNKYFIEK
jgi:putative hydrolase of HD superfamily